jgi:hypothetical protein
VIGKPGWLAVGMVAGAVATILAERRVKRTVEDAMQRLTPEHMADEAKASLRAVADRFRQALDESKDARERREAELWRELEAPRGNGATHR